MPGLPTAGVSSTVRCLPRPCTRMSCTSSDHRPLSRALPTSDAPSGPGNISGKSVSTVTRQDIAPVPPWCSFLYCRSLSSFHAPLVFRRVVLLNGNDDARGSNIDDGHGLAREGEKDISAIGLFDLDDIARAEIVDGLDGAERAAFRVFDAQA